MREKIRLLLQMLKIGILGFGGGSAVIPIMEQTFSKEWKASDNKKFQDDIVIASITPGALPVELASAQGRRWHGLFGMLAAPVFLALPGAIGTLILCVLINQFREKVVTYVHIVTLFLIPIIVWMLLRYVRKVVRAGFEDSVLHGKKTLGIVAFVFLLNSGKNVSNLFQIPRNYLFIIPTIHILLVVFWISFYAQARRNYKRMIISVVLGATYLWGHSGFLITLPNRFLQMVHGLMVVLLIYAVIKNYKNRNKSFTLQTHGLIQTASIWLGLVLISVVICLLLHPEYALFAGKCLLSVVLSFGGGDAYLTVADALFVDGGYVFEEQYLTEIVPIVNMMPGSILCKTMISVGYYFGTNEGSSLIAYMMALTGFLISISMSCLVFWMAKYLWDGMLQFTGTDVVKRWICPVISGLLLNIVVSLLYQMLGILNGFL